MTESVDYRAEFNIEDFVDKYVERVNREIDQRVLDKVEHRLAEYGYVKVVRCRDCSKWHHIDTEDGIRYGECDEWRRADSYCVPATNEDGFCAWAKRDEGGRTNEKALITIALQLVRYHYDKDDEMFDESCIELERWCHERGKVDLAEFAMACRCPEFSFIPMEGGEDE